MVSRILLGLIHFYRRAVSPWTPPACRFVPTCSAYAQEAVERHGPWRGAWLALRRLLRCHPFGGSGWDPVPRAGSGSASTDAGSGSGSAGLAGPSRGGAGTGER